MTITRSTIADLLPQHFEDDYPKFVDFVYLYFKWMHRRGDEDALVGGVADDFLQQAHVDREFTDFTTKDGEVFVTSNERSLKASDYFGNAGDHWLKDIYFEVPPAMLNKVHDNLTRIDLVSLIKRMADLWDMRGTKKGIEVLFKMFTGNDVTVNFPRDNLAAVDDGMRLDDFDSVLRDDDFWNEYTIQVTVAGEVAGYLNLILHVYYPHFHPAGFKIAVAGSDGTWAVDTSNPYESCDEWLDALNEVGYIPWVDRDGVTIDFGNRVLPPSGLAQTGGTWQLRTNYGRSTYTPVPNPPPNQNGELDLLYADQVWGHSVAAGVETVYAHFDPATGTYTEMSTDEFTLDNAWGVVAKPDRSEILQVLHHTLNYRVRRTLDHGISWTESTDTELLNTMRPISGNPSQNIAWCWDGTNYHMFVNHDMLITPDGVTWTRRQGDDVLTGIANSQIEKMHKMRFIDGGFYASSSADSTDPNRPDIGAYYSADGINWVVLDDPLFADTVSQNTYGGEFVHDGAGVLYATYNGAHLWRVNTTDGTLDRMGDLVSYGLDNADKITGLWEWDDDVYISIRRDSDGRSFVYRFVVAGNSLVQVFDAGPSIAADTINYTEQPLAIEYSERYDPPGVAIPVAYIEGNYLVVEHLVEGENDTTTARDLYNKVDGSFSHSDSNGGNYVGYNGANGALSPVGFMKSRDDLTTFEIHLKATPTSIGFNASFPSFMADYVHINVSNFTFGFNFETLIQPTEDGRYITGACLSEDQYRLTFVVSDTIGGAAADTWYQVEHNGTQFLIVDQGTISPSVSGDQEVGKGYLGGWPNVSLHGMTVSDNTYRTFYRGQTSYQVVRTKINGSNVWELDDGQQDIIQDLTANTSYTGDGSTALDITTGNVYVVGKQTIMSVRWDEPTPLGDWIDEEHMTAGTPMVGVCNNGVVAVAKDKTGVVYSTDMTNWTLDQAINMDEILGPPRKFGYVPPAQTDPGYNIGFSAEFDGTGVNNHLYDPSQFNLGATVDTIAFWIKRDDTGTSRAIVRSGLGTHYAVTYLNSGGQLRVYNVTSNVANINLTSTNSILPGVWTHVTIHIDTFNADETQRVRAYFNGIQQSWLNTGQIYPNSGREVWHFRNTPLYIGYDPTWNYRFVGKMADFTFWVGYNMPPETFGRRNAHGKWVPVAHAGPSDGDGTSFWLNFADANDMGKDVDQGSASSKQMINDWTGKQSTDVPPVS